MRNRSRFIVEYVNNRAETLSHLIYVKVDFLLTLFTTCSFSRVSPSLQSFSALLYDGTVSFVLTGTIPGLVCPPPESRVSEVVEVAVADADLELAEVEMLLGGF